MLNTTIRTKESLGQVGKVECLSLPYQGKLLLWWESFCGSSLCHWTGDEDFRLIGLKLMYANSKGDMKHREWDIEMNDAKLLNYAPTQQTPPALPIFPQKTDGKKHSVPIGFWKRIRQTPWDCPNPQNCKTSKNPMEIPFFTPLATNGDPLYIYYFAITWYGLIVSW